jgi:hypothetical protein
MKFRQFKPKSSSIGSFFLLALFAMTFHCDRSAEAQSTPTNIQVSGSVQQSSVTRLGVNLSDQTYWDSGQMTKNLTFKNPGFEGMKYRVIFHCASTTANTCTDDNQYNAQPTGYWNGASYRVMTGNAAGVTGTIVTNTNNHLTCGGCGPTLQFDQPINLAAGDYFSAEIYVPGNGDAGWWDDTTGGGTITTETTDISPESPGKQAIVLSAAAGKSVSITQYFDCYSGLSFVQMNGNYSVTFRAKAIGGSNKMTVNVMRIATGSSPFMNQVLTLTNSWQDYTLTFSANENGSALGAVQLVFTTTGSNVELDDVSMQKTNTDPANTTIFRDEVVDALKGLNPGTIRMMAAGAALGSDLPDQLQPTLARYRGGFNADGTAETELSYGIHEFLQLCQTVGSDPWITIPTATTPDEMTDFIEYLTGNGSDPWSALRISRGQVAPWTSVFGRIHLELGNETWNGIFKGETMNYPGYPQWANTIFGTARQAPGFAASKFDLVLSGWSAVAGFNAQMLTTSNQHDSLGIAPYLIFSANDEPMSTMFGALYTEPELFSSPGGQVYNDLAAVSSVPGATGVPTNLNVYETNLSPIEGNITQTELNQFTPSLGAGLGHTVHMLQMQRLGIKYQNAFALGQYAFLRADHSSVKLWGIVVDMGNTNRKRPQYLTQAMANSAIGGKMLVTSQTGANPTWNQPLSSDNVQMNGVHDLQSFAYLNGNTASVIVFNLSQTTALPVTFSGENSPSGSVTMTQITSANITDNNETSQVVTPTTQTLSGFNAAAGLSLPANSMTVLSWTANFAQAPLFSVGAGTYSAIQTVALSTITSGAAIYYTTDGSTPTTGSSLYTSPITVSKTQTIQAIAVAANLTTSPVASALYTIQPVAASPVFTPGAGTYNANQAVTITDGVAGSTIYYTMDGSTPTTSSSVYSGPITVKANETVKAIAAAANYTNSLASSAAYVIAPPTAAPVFSVVAGTYTKSQIVQFGDTMSGAVFYYTLDGSTPTTSSLLYNGYVTVSNTATLKGIAIVKGYSSSAVTAATYTIAPNAAIPVLSVPGGTYSAPQTITITDATPGSTIYYTTNQLTPTTASTKYTGPVTIAGAQYLQAVAIAPGYTVSFVASAMYNVTGTAVATPVLSLASGTYTGTQTVSAADATSGAVLYYTTNGTTPTSASTKYTAPVTVAATETLNVIGIKSGAANSAVANGAYTILTPAATPLFSLSAGSYTGTQTVSITDATAGVSIYYTTDGSTPTTGSMLYSAPITVGVSETVSAIASSATTSVSPVATAAYTILAPATVPPTVNFANGFASNSLTLNANASLSGTAVQLTNGANQAGTAWYPKQVSVAGFKTAFDFQLSSSNANGFTFTIQNDTRQNYAHGNDGNGLGYQWITKSVAIAFNLSQSGVTNAQSVGVYTGGVVPQGSAINLAGTGINLHSGDTFHAVITYVGTTLTVTLTDKVTGATVTETFTVNVASSVGASTAYVGFTGSTGTLTAVQSILNWTYGN